VGARFRGFVVVENSGENFVIYIDQISGSISDLLAFCGNECHGIAYIADFLIQCASLLVLLLRRKSGSKLPHSKELTSNRPSIAQQKNNNDRVSYMKYYLMGGEILNIVCRSVKKNQSIMVMRQKL
jgi:hypothetical protein